MLAIIEIAEDFKRYMYGADKAEYQARKDSFKVIETNKMENKGKNSNNQKGELEQMPYIKFRKDGRYEAVISFKGKHFSVYEKDKSKLQQKITKKIKELNREYKNQITLAKKIQDNLTLRNYYEKWLEEDKKPFISIDTLNSITNAFETHILPKLGSYKLSNLEKSTIQKFLNNIPNSRIKNLMTTYFKSCITKAYKERLIEYNPFDTVVIDKKITSEKTGFSASQQKEILQYLINNEKEFYYIVLFFLCTGCRRSELARIKSEDISKNLLLIKQTKPKPTIRYINISNEFESLIKNKIDLIKKFSIVWTTKKFAKILKLLNLKGSIHSLRHSFATNHYYLGTQTKQVQTWLGHASIKMTMDIYTNLDPKINPKEEKESIKKLYNNLYYYSD